MYWVVLAVVATLESLLSFALAWVPFYAWLRLGLHLYLVMPGQAGATALYQSHVDPFLAAHEADIEGLISDAHERARSAGLQYLKAALEWVKVNVLGQQPRPQAPPPPGSYAQQLLSRFSLPPAAGPGAPAGDVYGLLASALQSVGATAGGSSSSSSRSREARAEDLSASGSLIPPGVESAEERMSYVTRQRENLRVLLQAFDREAFNIAGQEQQQSAGLAKSRSEVDFERIETDEAPENGASKAGKTVQGGWMPWSWGGSPPAGEAGRSSGVDVDH